VIHPHKKEVLAGIKFFPSGDEVSPLWASWRIFIEDVENFGVL
jgi:hypothetical protein